MGTQGRNLETVSKAETTGKYCLLAYPLFSVQLPFLCRPGQVLRDGTTNRAEITSIRNQENACTDMPAGQSDEGTLQGPSSWSVML